MHIRNIFIFTVVILGLSGCATIWHGTEQELPIRSEPDGAKVYVDGEYIGQTPVEVTLRRSRPHRIGLTMPGHEMGIIEIEPNFSSVSWFNVALLPGVFAGFLVDSITGGLYELSVGNVDHHMVKQTQVPRVQ